MEKDFRRDMNKNYLIIRDTGEIQADNYKIRMLISNNIPGLLKFNTRIVDNKVNFYYEITSMQPLARIYEKKKMSEEDVKSIMISVVGVVDSICEYLLSTEDIIIEPDMIYKDLDHNEYCFCYIPGYGCDIRQSVRQLLEYVLDRIDYNDNKCVAMAYGLYKRSQTDNFSIHEMVDCVMDNAESKDSELPMDKSNPNEINSSNEHSEDEDNIAEYHESEVGPFPKEKKIIKRINPVIPREVCTEEREVDNSSKVKKLLYTMMVVADVICMGIFIWIVSRADLTNTTEQLKCAGVLVAIIAINGAVIGKIKSISMVRIIGEECEVPFETSYDENVLNETNLKTEKKMTYEIDEQTGTVLLASCKEDDMLICMDRSGSEDITISQYPFTIGKSKELADFAIDNNAVSRMHLRIDKIEDKFIVTDLNSKNGTYINNRQLEANEQVCINRGDELKIANILYVFR